jgi:hypothetical protein
METLKDINIEHDEFIGTYEKLMTPEECGIMIDFFDQTSTVNGFHYDRRQQTSGHDQRVKDKAVGFDDLVYGWKSVEHALPGDELQQGLEAVHGENGILTKLYDAFHEYVLRYDIWKQNEYWISRSFKLQKTSAGDGSGYHVWHSEYAPGQYDDRFAAWILYLNDVEEGGETEFLYQSKRIQPRQGDLAVWPAYYTHAHRGNPPLRGDKYILTGWLHASEPRYPKP